MSENRFDATTAREQTASMDWARYWFDQYRYASSCEARLIQAIRELSMDRERTRRELE